MLFWAAFSLICLLLVAGTINRPSIAMIGIWCMYGLEQWAQSNQIIFIEKSWLINIFIGVNALIGFLLMGFKRGNPFKNYPMLAILILILFAYSFISVQWSPRIDLSYDLWRKFWPYLITLLIINPLLFSKHEDIKPVLSYFVIIGGILVYMLAFEVEWFHRRIVLTGGRGGFSHYLNEQLGNPLTVAQLGGYVFFSALLIKEHSIKILKILKWPIAALCLVLIIRSGSRGQLIGVFFSLMLTWPLVNKVSNIKGFFTILFLLASITWVVTWSLDEFWKGSSRWKDSEMEQSMGGRFDNAFVLLDHWGRSGIKMFIGLGNSASFDPRILGIYPHFLPFEILGEEGIIGFSLYILILIFLLKTIIRTYKKIKLDIKMNQYAAVLLSMVFYSFLLSLKQGSLLGNMEFFMAAIILAKYEKIVENTHRSG
ncbi:hypothetical protein [Methylomonas rapida]|jgi:hypothetical protein|uniref:O-antigen polymerase n=1 Tax=Methylomonas rapida TaxID=2963939 RepID=A0ABY7GLH0_9GAMM|nr:hypothetical protein [Methylomonas rapida]WAR45344.1 hypothetical protein NM686_002190 [Methylomonas rapida]